MAHSASKFCHRCSKSKTGSYFLPTEYMGEHGGGEGVRKMEIPLYLLKLNFNVFINPDTLLKKKK